MKLIKANIYALLDALISCGGQLYDSIVYIQQYLKLIYCKVVLLQQGITFSSFLESWDAVCRSLSNFVRVFSPKQEIFAPAEVIAVEIVDFLLI